MTDPHTRDAGLRRITSITGWVAAAAVSGAALVSVGVARADANSNANASETTTTTDPRVSQAAPNDPWTPTYGGGIQPPVNPPAQGLGGGTAVSGGS